MHKIAYIILFVFLFSEFSSATFAKALIGEITKDDFKIEKSIVIDAITRQPLSDAKISIPVENKFVFTDKNGHFKISSNSDKTIILSVQKDGYRPYSLTLQDGKLPKNLMIALEKNYPFSFVLSDSLLHLGDNSFSENSSGACLINAPCIGPQYIKKFTVSKLDKNTKAYLTIGSIIGIDTLQAMKLKQNTLTSATSTPVEIFVNKTKVAELKINGDNHKIPIPASILKVSNDNTLIIKTGINQNNPEYTDYDDIELMNIIVDIKD